MFPMFSKELLLEAKILSDAKGPGEYGDREYLLYNRTGVPLSNLRRRAKKRVFMD